MRTSEDNKTLCRKVTEKNDEAKHAKQTCLVQTREWNRTAAVWSFIVEILAHLINCSLISRVTNKKHLYTSKNDADSPRPHINLEKGILRISLKSKNTMFFEHITTEFTTTNVQKQFKLHEKCFILYTSSFWFFWVFF